MGTPPAGEPAMDGGAAMVLLCVSGLCMAATGIEVFRDIEGRAALAAEGGSTGVDFTEYSPLPPLLGTFTGTAGGALSFFFSLRGEGTGGSEGSSEMASGVAFLKAARQSSFSCLVPERHGHREEEAGRGEGGEGTGRDIVGLDVF